MNPPSSLRHPGRWLWLLLAIPVAIGLYRLRFDVEVFDLLPSNLEAVAGLKLYQQHFANARELIVTIEGSKSEETEAAARVIAEALRKNSNLVSAITWEPPWLEHPEQAGELLGYLWLNQPPAIFRELTNRLAPNKLAESLAATRDELGSTMSPNEIARLSYDPFGLTRLPESASGAAPNFAQGQELFGSADGRFRMVFIQANRDLRTYRRCDDWLKAIKPVIDESLSNAGLKTVSLGYTGRPAFVSEIALGMQHDVQLSVGGTAAIIAVLFWLAHRRVKPMLWLLTLLALILGSTLAFGGLIYGTINVVSMGFAAILLGLAVDYAVVHYQEALAHPDLSIPQIRSAIAPSIFWAAVTTISAFLVLNFGGLPGLGQLGTLVGIGVALSACIMIFEFLPPLFPGRQGSKQNSTTQTPDAPASNLSRTQVHEAAVSAVSLSRVRSALTFGVTLLVIFLAVGVLFWLGRPTIDPTANALRPRKSPAYAALDKIQKNLSQKREPLWIVLQGDTESEIATRLAEVESVLNRAASNQWIASFNLPTPLWPRPEFQKANRDAASALLAERSILHQAAQSNGFSEVSVGLADRILDTWQTARSSSGTFWPTNPMSDWIFQKFAARTGSNFFALGLVTPLPISEKHGKTGLAELRAELPRERTWLSGWELLGSAIFSRVQTNMWKVLSPMVALVLLSLWLAFRRPREILLSLSVMGLSAACLLATMRLAGWSWNLLNLMAVPLILGTGIDYSIFMQLALRRHHGDLRMAYFSVGRALLLCGGTAIAGFGMLALSSNAGMSSLGKVCAVGIGSNMLIAIYLLPVWWRSIRSRSPTDAPQPAPSSLYCSGLWRAGLWLVRKFPPGPLIRLAKCLAGGYWLLARHRREILIANLLPALNGNRLEAQRTARKLMSNFAVKIVDLFRYEAGLPIDDLFGQTTGWESLTDAHNRKRGVLLLTCHLGNWELGGPWLTRKGIPLQVVTLAEPGAGFTQLRESSRARWNIETLVIGANPFAIVDVIRRLENGATVALLIDRPPASSSLEVNLFGHPFAASVAAVELARASGCALIPVYLPRYENNYGGHVLPEIPYDRASLRGRAATVELTQKIIDVFEPVIRKHLDQWYHFVPIWPENRKQSH